MDKIDAQLAALLVVPERRPDTRFAHAITLRIAAERRLVARVAAERARTATLLASTVSLSVGLWLFAQGSAFAAASEAAGGGIVSFAAVATVMLLWLGTGAAGSLASD